MNRKIGFSFLLLVLVCSIFFSACEQDLTKTYKSHLADFRTTFFEGQTENFAVTFTTGLREEPYNLDGTAFPLVDFGVLTIYPNANCSKTSFKFSIEIDGEPTEGDFEKSPFDNSFAADIKKQVSCDAEVFVYIKDGQMVEVCKLNCVSKQFAIDAEKAVLVAIDDGGAALKEFLKNTNFEIYVKVIVDLNGNLSEKFWYVMFLREDQAEYAVIIDPNSSKILTKSSNNF